MACKGGEDAQRMVFRWAVGVVFLAVMAMGILVLFAKAPAQALTGDLAAIAKASDLDNDPKDFQAVTAVCTRCHASFQFLTTPRSDNRWEQVFSEMSGYGATGSDDQLNRVVSYFQKNLTIINVNTSPAEDLGPTLQVDDNVVAAIVARRAQHPFADIDDLSKIAGVDRAILEKLKAKNCLLF